MAIWPRTLPGTPGFPGHPGPLRHGQSIHVITGSKMAKNPFSWPTTHPTTSPDKTVFSGHYGILARSPREHGFVGICPFWQSGHESPVLGLGQWPDWSINRGARVGQ